MNRALEILGESFGITTLLLEGGGITTGPASKRATDRRNQPSYLSRDRWSFRNTKHFECVGKSNEQPAAGQSLRHIATETLKGGMVWLRHSVETNPAFSET